MSVYCINPDCKDPVNPDEVARCGSCGLSLSVCKPYRVVKQLHKNLFEVVDREQNQAILKTITLDEPEFEEFVNREFEILKRLEYHPGFPSVKEKVKKVILEGVDKEKALGCLILEKIDGIDLGQWFDLYGVISELQAVRWLKDLLYLLNVLHQQYGFIHRDIKPSNVMVRSDNSLVLIDLGSSRLLTREYRTALNRDGSKTIVTSKGFTPLEQLQGKAVPQSDFFALARTIVFLMTGIDPKDPKFFFWKNYVRVSPGFSNLLEDMMREKVGDRPGSVDKILWRLNHPRLDRPLRLVRSKPFCLGSVGAIALAVVLAVPTIGYELFFVKGARFYENRQYAEAEVAWREGLKYRETAELYNNVASSCEQQQKWECAAENYDMALKFIDPNDHLLVAIINFNVGLNFDFNQDFEKAEFYYRQAIEFGYPSSAAKSNLSRILLIKPQLQILSADTLQQTLHESVQLAIEGLEIVETSFFKNVDIDTSKAILLKNLGWANYLLQNYEVAEAKLKLSMNLHPDRPDAFYLLAKVCEATDRNQEALNYWNDGYEIAVKNPPKEGVIEIVKWHNEAIQRIF